MKFFVPSWNKTTGYFIRNIQQDQYVPGQVHLLCRLYQKPAQHSIILRTEKRFLEDDGNKAPELEKEHCFLSSSQSQENKKQPSHKGTTSPRQFKCSLTKRNCVGICSKRVKQINICYLLQRVAACELQPTSGRVASQDEKPINCKRISKTLCALSLSGQSVPWVKLLHLWSCVVSLLTYQSA